MIRKLTAVLLFLVFASFSLAQEANPDPNVLKQFTRSAKFNDITLYFVLMNNRTVEALFQAPTKYSMRARANMSTMLYVQGTPDKDGILNTDFTLQQNSETTSGTAVNIKNFKAGAVTKGERIDGILQFDKKIDVTHSFIVKNGDASVEFKLTPEALKLLEPQPPEAAAKK